MIRTHSQLYSGIFGTLSYSAQEAYSEPWYFQNPRHIHNPVNIYDEAFLVNGYNYFHKLQLFSQYKQYDINIMIFFKYRSNFYSIGTYYM